MRIRNALSIATLITLAGMMVFAQGRGHGGPPGVAHGKPAGVPKGPKPGQGHATADKTHASQGAAPRTVSEHLAAKPQLQTRLQGLLPAGTNVDQASTGFKRLGQFVAAVVVSHNLGIPFDALKTHVTGNSAVSLGEAIHQLRPDANAKSEAARADAQARELIDQADHQ